MISVSQLHKVLLTCCATFAWCATQTHAEEEKLPSLAQVQQTVESWFRAAADHRPGDLISKSQVEQVLKALEKLGWQVPDRAELLSDVLDDQHMMVRTFRTSAGKRFMRKISGRELIYDRFERIASVSSGPQLIQDIVKLPDGERYAKPRSGGGVPDLLDLLPKNASGKTRRISDYDKATGHLYTVADLIDRLAESYQETEKALAEKN